MHFGIGEAAIAEHGGTGLRFSLFDSLFFQLPGQRAAVHAEPTSGFGNIEVSFGQYLMNAFPFQGFDGGRAVSQFYFARARHMAESRFDIVSVRGFCEVLAGAQFDGFDSRVDAGKSS